MSESVATHEPLVLKRGTSPFLEKPMQLLRWKAGVLQQQWRIEAYDASGRTLVEYLWRDVPHEE